MASTILITTERRKDPSRLHRARTATESSCEEKIEGEREEQRRRGKSSTLRDPRQPSPDGRQHCPQKATLSRSLGRHHPIAWGKVMCCRENTYRELMIHTRVIAVLYYVKFVYILGIHTRLFFCLYRYLHSSAPPTNAALDNTAALQAKSSHYSCPTQS